MAVDAVMWLINVEILLTPVQVTGKGKGGPRSVGGVLISLS